jgi:hypothetical protein
MMQVSEKAPIRTNSPETGSATADSADGANEASVIRQIPVHLAHNTNLSIKAIEALAAYAQLGKMLGHDAQAKKCEQAARTISPRWPTTWRTY